MILTQEKQAEMKAAARPLNKFLSENYHPHVEVRVDCTDVVFLEMSCRVRTLDFVDMAITDGKEPLVTLPTKGDKL